MLRSQDLHHGSRTGGLHLPNEIFLVLEILCLCDATYVESAVVDRGNVEQEGKFLAPWRRRKEPTRAFTTSLYDVEFVWFRFGNSICWLSPKSVRCGKNLIEDITPVV